MSPTWGFHITWRGMWHVHICAQCDGETFGEWGTSCALASCLWVTYLCLIPPLLVRFFTFLVVILSWALHYRQTPLIKHLLYIQCPSMHRTHMSWFLPPGSLGAVSIITTADQKGFRLNASSLLSGMLFSQPGAQLSQFSIWPWPSVCLFLMGA